MKKRLSIIFCSFIGATSVLAQTVVPKPIPCMSITSANINFLGSGINAVDCIVTGGNLNFNSDQHYSIKAGEFISFGQETVINPDPAHQFHAYIDNGGMEIGWYHPNGTPGTVGQFDKLELGVEFRDDIDQLIENFTADNQISPNLNPFNPDQVDLFAEFWWYNDGSLPIPIGWYDHQKINGFFYKEYIRGTTDWSEQPNQHDFRIRFAPRRTGLWRCKIKANVQGFGTFIAPEFTFNCVPSTSKDFVSVGDNGRYFKIGNEPFFPVGHNVTSPRLSADEWELAFDFIQTPNYFEAYANQLEVLKASGANYFRFINTPQSTDIEFEKLGDYSQRMIHAWEMDNILVKADSLDLRIHFNMQIHNTFEVPHYYGAGYWDWPKYGDTMNVDCAAMDDSGYCYRTELDLENPKDFFTNLEAIKHYKNKIRYIIARWGYSNEIAVIELFSEINNAGNIANMQPVVVGYDTLGNEILGCVDQGGPGTGKPYDNDPVFRNAIFLWQHEMATFIKDSLEHTIHPISVSYAGAPTINLSPFPSGDLSYGSNKIDINTFNHYSLSLEKNAGSHYIATNLTNTFNKPFMFSEYGTGAGHQNCDNGVDFIKTLLLSPFTGTAGAAMNWDWQFPGQEFYWHFMGPVKDFMSGIKLDEENWVSMPPVVSNNKAVEILYLRNFVADNYRVAGAVSNRTYNYFTQAIGSPCDIDDPLPQELAENTIYQDVTAYISTVAMQVLVIPLMGKAIDYKINWYNAKTGLPVDVTEVTSLNNGDLELHFPLLTGHSTQPILFFEIYRLDQPSFKSAAQDSIPNNDKVILQVPEKDTTHFITTVTNWKVSVDTINLNLSPLNSIFLSPNPSNEYVDIRCSSDYYLGGEWQLRNLNGEILKTDQISSPNFSIDLSVYASGLYYFYIMTNTETYVHKIIKQ